MKLISYLTFLLLFPSVSQAHTFTGMVGFYDGISHPVLGADHFLAMISVGIVSVQIGGRAVWTVPATFVLIMLVGGIISMFVELNQILNSDAINLSDINQKYNIADFLNIIIEFGILISVIILGLSIAIEKKLPVFLTIIFVGIFGFFHGSAHGLEIPWAASPALFALGFATGTATLHLFGVMIGYFLMQTRVTLMILRLSGLSFACFGIYSLCIF